MIRGTMSSRTGAPSRVGPGDVWQLGAHRLICGDALEPGVVATLMAGEQARMVFTDPPYNVPIDGHVGGSGKTKHREFAMASGEMSSEEFTGFLQRAFERLSRGRSRRRVLRSLLTPPPPDNRASTG